MAECIVLKSSVSWKAGDHIEAFGGRLEELVKEGAVRIIVPDVEDKVVEVQKPEEVIGESKPKGKGRSKK